MQRMLRTTAVVVGATGATVGAAYGMLSQQGRRARRDIVIPGWRPFRADGVYLPDGTGPYPPSAAALTPGLISFAMLGDSLAAGLGVDGPEQLPGAVLARGLAKDADLPVQLETLAICGCTSGRLQRQADLALSDPPQVAMIMIGANDVTRRVPPWESAKRLGEAVSRLRAAGTTVIVGTCPDLGTIRLIPQPLRALAHTSSLTLARLQRDAVFRAGGLVVPLAQLLAHDFLTQPETMFSRDQYHPSSAGYDAACTVLLPALCSALGGSAPEGSAPESSGLSAGGMDEGSKETDPVIPRRGAGSVATGWLATRFGSTTAVEGSPGTARPG